jgi:hypothetical protein
LQARRFFGRLAMLYPEQRTRSWFGPKADTAVATECEVSVILFYHGPVLLGDGTGPPVALHDPR